MANSHETAILPIRRTPCLSKTRKDQSRHFFPNILLSMPTSLLALLITLRSILRSRLDLQLEPIRARFLSDGS
jgi:hypothetical protein